MERQLRAEEERRRAERERALLAARQREQERKDRAERALQAAQQAFDALDRGFIDKWARGALDELPALLRQLEQHVARSELEAALAALNRIQAVIQAAIEKADEIYGKEQKRLEIVKGIRSSLRDMGFEAGATLADKDEPTGSVIVSANHPSQRRVEMAVDLDTDNIRMNLDDDDTTNTRVGADCVVDVKEIIRRLSDQGIDMEMTDWGYAHPDRSRPEGAQVESAERGVHREA